jgi:hypothetical protein
LASIVSSHRVQREYGRIESAWYDEGMKTLLISGGETPPPAPLVDLIARGSTALEQRRSADLLASESMPDADRIVFWSASDDSGVREVAARYHRAEQITHREAIVFVSGSRSDAFPTLPNTETYVWPQDQDRLEMAFLTGA